MQADLPLADLWPGLIPNSSVAFGPQYYFEKLPLSLTRANLRREHTLQYLADAHSEKLAADGID